MKIAICDDEKIMRQQVRNYLESMQKSLSIDEYDNGHDLIRSKISYDIVFLDIEMPEISGMNVAEKLRNANFDSHIIFMTSHVEYVLDAFKVKAFRFLTKPIDRQAFQEAFENAENEIESEEKIVISFRGRFTELKLRDIKYIEASGDGTYIYDRFDKVHESTVQLKELEEKLQGKYFFKVHKSYIVSLYYVRSIEGNDLNLFDTREKITVSRRNLTCFKNAYMEFIRNNAQVI